MSISLQCPTCEARLKLLEAPAAGQRVECPKCGLTFLPQEDETPRRVSKQKRRDDDDDAPPQRKPAPRRPRDGDDDDAPRQRKPVSRRAKDDDHDPSAQKRQGLLIGLGIGAGLFLLLGIAGGAVYFVTRGNGKPQPEVAANTGSVENKGGGDKSGGDGNPRPEGGTQTPTRKAPGVVTPPVRQNPPVKPAVPQDPPVKPEVPQDPPVKPAVPQDPPVKPAVPQDPPVKPAVPQDPPVKPAVPQDPPVKPPVPEDPPAKPRPDPADAAPPVRKDPPAISKNADLTPALEEKMRKATVFVQVSFSNGKGQSGSGFIVRSNEDLAYLVTNHHVIAEEIEKPADPAPGRPGMGRPPGFPGRIPVPTIPGFGRPGKNNKPEPKENTREINVEFFRGTEHTQSYSAEVVAEDPEYDLAVLKVTGRNFPAAISLADEAGIAETMPVRVFGFPLGRKDLLMSKGVVSQLRKNAQGEINDVQINADLNHGSSGGPVVDTAGKLVGVAVAGVQGKNLAWAVPTTHLNHMFRGTIEAGILCKLRKQGVAVAITGEVWRFDRKNSVDDRKVVDVVVDKNAGNQAVPADEFMAIAFLSDPMHKIASAKVLYAENKPGTIVKDGAGWGPMRNAKAETMNLRDRTGQAVIKMPGSIPDEVYAIQFTYVNGDGKTVCMEPHLVRFTFPKSIKQVTLNITGLPDDPTKRYITDSLKDAVPNTTFNATPTPTGLNVTIDPVEDPKALADRLTFGTAKVTGWTISVTAKKIELPPPTEQEVEQALKDLKSGEGRLQHPAADRMAKCYTVLPSRRAEVSKALGAIITETTKMKDNPWPFRGAVMNALKMWAGPESVPVLVAYLDWVLDTKAPWPQSEGDAIAILAKLKDPSSAAVLAKYLPNGFVRGTVANALKAMGPAAEKAVIPILENKDGWTVREACGVLKEIGTKESIEPLQKVVDKKDGFISGPANEALQAISKRK